MDPEAIRVGGICGSLGSKSYNLLLLRAAAEMMPEDVLYEEIPIGDLPLYNPDLDGDSAPEAVRLFRDRVKAVDGLLFTVPEYNYSLTGALKNALDWASRPVADSGLYDKPAAIMGASQGTFGTVRAQLHFRHVAVFTNMHLVNKPEVLVREPRAKFSADGRLEDGETRQLVGQLVRELVRWTRVVRSGRAELSAR
jgi:chromate reductase